jgi:hypothetical protein
VERRVIGRRPVIDSTVWMTSRMLVGWPLPMV